MSSEIIVNAGREETRVALLENGLVTEIYIDRKKDRGIAGNVYKGRVMLRSLFSALLSICLTLSRVILHRRPIVSRVMGSPSFNPNRCSITWRSFSVSLESHLLTCSCLRMFSE